MGGKKRKATTGPTKKESKYKIPRRFDCPVCDAKASIAVKVVSREGHKEAFIKCRHCGLGGGDQSRPMLPLEKAVDAFFAFREELMEKDRAYLDRHGLDIGGVTTAATARNASSGFNNINSGSGAVMYASSAHPTAAAGEGSAALAVSTAAGSTGVRNLADLDRTVNHSNSEAGRKGGYAATARAIDEDMTGTAEHYFAPREAVDSEEDAYEAMFS